MIATADERIDLPQAWLGMPGAIEVDLGCHKGVFLEGMAAQYPEIRFLGIERQSSRVARCLARIARLELHNAHAIRGEGLAFLRDAGLPVAVIHVSFPDPWPKRRHHIRRLVNGAFLRDAAGLLMPRGMLRLMTDDAPYFRAMEAAAKRCGGFEPVPWDDGREYPSTEFQRKFAAQAKPIYRLALRRCDSSNSE